MEFFISSLNNEDHNLCSEAANTALSATRLHQRLTIFKRYFIALNRSSFEHTATKKINIETNETKPQGKIKSIKHPSSITNPVVGLARVGSRAALNFSFAFLRKAWRLGIFILILMFDAYKNNIIVGEDTDLCSELLTEALEALQLLPVATLFEESTVSPIWLEVVERSAKFLRQVVTG